ERWRFSTASAVLSEPVIDAQGTVYVGTADGTLYAVYGSSPPAKTSWPMVRRDLRHTGAVSYPVYDQMVLGMQMYAGLTFTGNIGSTYRIEAANVLGDTNSLQALTTHTIDRSPYLFIVIESTNNTRRFYRAIQLPC